MPEPDDRPHVVLITSDRAVSDVLTLMLASAGCWVIAADGPIQATAKVDLVVVDDGPFGVGLAPRLAAIREWWPRVPILVLLASASAGAWLAIADDGRAGALEKPFSAGALVQAVQELMTAPSRSEGT
jgi:CheY-like chemotaxis protein